METGRATDRTCMRSSPGIVEPHLMGDAASNRERICKITLVSRCSYTTLASIHRPIGVTPAMLARVRSNRNRKTSFLELRMAHSQINRL